MGDPGHCANPACGAQLSPDQPAGNRYCATCTAAYLRGAAAQQQPGPVDEGAAQTDPGHCANCGTPLPPGQSAESRYCAKCTAAWQRGPTARAIQKKR
jgi:predicted RNA-binding Zn-ribbon protein involved in translation (DUF1610 family)